MMNRTPFGMVKMAQMHHRAYEDATPIQATFELTPRCGFNCRMCYVHLPPERIPYVGDGRELTGEEWLELGRQAADMGVLELCITGGDPICHPDFPAIWTGLAQMGFRLTLQTNASQLTGDLLDLLDEYLPEMVKITLYGSNDQVYREVCRVERGFTRVDEGIQALKERGHAIQLVTTFIQQNREDAQSIAAYAKSNELPWYYSAACHPSLRGADSEAETCAIPMWDETGAEELSKLWNSMKPASEDIPAKLCSGYRTAFNISWDGNMRFCLFVSEPNLSVVGRDLQECWQELLAFWEGLRWPEECYTCDYRSCCRKCLAHLACFSGGLGRLDRTYCEKMKRIMNMTPCVGVEKEN